MLIKAKERENNTNKKNDLVKQGINKKSQTDDVSCDFKR